jgi:hypothetical protein
MTHQSSRPAASRTPCWVGASPPFSWRQRLSWLISALSGTVDLEIEINERRETWKREDEQRKLSDERWKKFDERLKEFDSKSAAPPDPSPSNSTTPPPTEPV